MWWWAGGAGGPLLAGGSGRQVMFVMFAMFAMCRYVCYVCYVCSVCYVLLFLLTSGASPTGCGHQTARCLIGAVLKQSGAWLVPPKDSQVLDWCHQTDERSESDRYAPKTVHLVETSEASRTGTTTKQPPCLTGAILNHSKPF